MRWPAACRSSRCPGPFMRGRQSAGMLSLLGVPELIAADRADYLAIAARLAGDETWRRELATRIGAAQSRLFDVSDAIERLQLLLQADDIRALLDRARSPRGRPRSRACSAPCRTTDGCGGWPQAARAARPARAARGRGAAPSLRSRRNRRSPAPAGRSRGAGCRRVASPASRRRRSAPAAPPAARRWSSYARRRETCRETDPPRHAAPGAAPAILWARIPGAPDRRRRQRLRAAGWRWTRHRWRAATERCRAPLAAGASRSSNTSGRILNDLLKQQNTKPRSGRPHSARDGGGPCGARTVSLGYEACGMCHRRSV